MKNLFEELRQLNEAEWPPHVDKALTAVEHGYKGALGVKGPKGSLIIADYGGAFTVVDEDQNELGIFGFDDDAKMYSFIKSKIGDFKFNGYLE